MKRLIFLLVGFGMYIGTVSAQSNQDFSDWVTCLIADPSGTLYAGAYSNGNGIFMSTDAGNHWTQTPMRYGVTSMTLTKNGTIVSFSFGAGFGRYLFRLTNNGADLDSVTLDFTPAQITTSQDGSLYATTFNEGIYKSTDDGINWNSIGNGIDPALLSSAIAITANGTILVSSSEAGLWWSSDSGKNWGMGYFDFHDSIYVQHILPFNDSTIYAGVFEGMGVNANEIYVSADTGKNWSLISTLTFDLDAMIIDSSGNVYAGNNNGVYRIAPNGDTTYLGLGGVAVNGWGVRSLLAYHKDTILAGARGGVYRTTDAGESWELLNEGMTSDSSNGNLTNPLPFGYYVSSGIVDSDGSLVVGTDSAGVFRSIDKGKTWLQTNLTVPFITGVVKDSLGNLWAASLHNGVYRSSNHGATWITTDDGGSMIKNREFYTLSAFVAHVPMAIDPSRTLAENIVFAGNDWGIYEYFVDGIGSWVPTGLITTHVSAITHIGSIDAVGSTFEGDVYVSPGGWLQWDYKGSVGSEVKVMVSDKAGTLFAVGPMGVFRSTDKGINWVQKNEGITDTNLVSATVDETGNIFVGSYQQGDIYKSTDHGEHWTIFTTLTYPVRWLFIEPNEGNLYAASANRIFWSGSGTTSVVENSNVLPKDFLLEQNYPNPFNPTTTITYILPKSSNVILKVYDALGREVATLDVGVKSAGDHRVQFNGYLLSSGIYFYRLQADGYRKTKKMILLR